jgi:hypothetical protein
MASGYHVFFSFVSQPDSILFSYRQGCNEGGGEAAGLQQPPPLPLKIEIKKKQIL